MDGARAVLAQRRDVFSRAIPLVARKTILRGTEHPARPCSGRATPWPKWRRRQSSTTARRRGRADAGARGYPTPSAASISTSVTGVPMRENASAKPRLGRLQNVDLVDDLRPHPGKRPRGRSAPRVPQTTDSRRRSDSFLGVVDIWHERLRRASPRNRRRPVRPAGHAPTSSMPASTHPGCDQKVAVAHRTGRRNRSSSDILVIGTLPPPLQRHASDLSGPILVEHRARRTLQIRRLPRQIKTTTAADRGPAAVPASCPAQGPVYRAATSAGQSRNSSSSSDAASASASVTSSRMEPI